MDGQMVQYDEGEARLGYLAVPEGGAGPAVLVFHAWWGLNDFFKSLCDRLAAEGYVAFAPDFYGGQVVDTIDEASHLVETGDRAAMQGALLEAVRFIEQQPGVRPAGIGVIGFSLGAAYAALFPRSGPTRSAPSSCSTGPTSPTSAPPTQPFSATSHRKTSGSPGRASRRCRPRWNGANCPASFHIYPDTGHWFFEANRADAYRPAAARTGLAAHVGISGRTDWGKLPSNDKGAGVQQTARVPARLEPAHEVQAVGAVTPKVDSVCGAACRSACGAAHLHPRCAEHGDVPAGRGGQRTPDGQALQAGARLPVEQAARQVGDEWLVLYRRERPVQEVEQASGGAPRRRVRPAGYTLARKAAQRSLPASWSAWTTPAAPASASRLRACASSTATSSTEPSAV